jgi:hypothetical protein
MGILKLDACHAGRTLIIDAFLMKEIARLHHKDRMLRGCRKGQVCTTTLLHITGDLLRSMSEYCCCTSAARSAASSQMATESILDLLASPKAVALSDFTHRGNQQ